MGNFVHYFPNRVYRAFIFVNDRLAHKMCRGTCTFSFRSECHVKSLTLHVFPCQHSRLWVPFLSVWWRNVLTNFSRQRYRSGGGDLFSFKVGVDFLLRARSIRAKGTSGMRSLRAHRHRCFAGVGTAPARLRYYTRVFQINTGKLVIKKAREAHLKTCIQSYIVPKVESPIAGT